MERSNEMRTQASDQGWQRHFDNEEARAIAQHGDPDRPALDISKATCMDCEVPMKQGKRGGHIIIRCPVCGFSEVVV